MENIKIRLETESDYRAVEELTRNAFWNVYKPGADEHYFVHTMRNHPDFIPELAFVLEKDGEIIGNIMYTKAWLATSGCLFQVLQQTVVMIQQQWRNLIRHFQLKKRNGCQVRRSFIFTVIHQL